MLILIVGNSYPMTMTLRYAIAINMFNSHCIDKRLEIQFQ